MVWGPGMSEGQLDVWLDLKKDQAPIRKCSESNTKTSICMDIGSESEHWPFNQIDIGSHWRVLSQKMDEIGYTVSWDHFVGLPH